MNKLQKIQITTTKQENNEQADATLEKLRPWKLIFVTWLKKQDKFSDSKNVSSLVMNRRLESYNN